MVTDEQVRRLRRAMQKHKKIYLSADKAGMDEKTASKYLKTGSLPSEVKKEHTWRTREDIFGEVWNIVKYYLKTNPGLEAKTLFNYLQRKYPGQFQDGSLRTLQRRVKIWRATEGPSKEVFFPQDHKPGILSQSDFTHMNDLGVTIGGILFDHLIYHFVLTYSNWETGDICFSESFQSLSEGLQNALWELGAVPEVHQTDKMTAAVQKPDNPEEFTRNYQALLNHYGLKGRKIQAGKANENGDVEQRHYRFKKALDQALMLRGSRDFANRKEYTHFFKQLFSQLNSGRKKRLEEELEVLHRLPDRRLDSSKWFFGVSVSSASTIRILKNIYSVHSRLIGEKANIRVYSEHIELWYAQRCLERIPRLRGERKHKIQYRHIIDWLVRKPGAFNDYRYQEDLFPTSRFRMVYDNLKIRHSLQKAFKEYLKILYLAAYEGEALVDDILERCLNVPVEVSAKGVEMMVNSVREKPLSKREVYIQPVNIIL